MMQNKRVGMLISPLSNNNCQMMRGVISYVQQHGRWEIATRRAIPSLHFEALGDWQGDGLIASIAYQNQYEDLLARGIPAVNVSACLETPALATVYSDNPAIGRSAAHHLLEMGLKHFAFVERANLLHDRQRGLGFAEALADEGYPCLTIAITTYPDNQSDHPNDVQDTQLIAKQLVNMKFPVGVFAAHDNLGCEVLDACRECGLHVPYQVAVVGVNDYELLCETAQPPLSSIRQQAHRIGYEAMRLLDRLVGSRKKHKPPPPPVLLPPGELVQRHSTDFLAIEDTDVAAAMTAIRANASHPIRVDDIMQRVTISRRTLDKKFIAIRGHPVATELRLARIKIAQRLLAQTDRQVLTIAMRSGFVSASGFSRAFRQQTGMTPKEYRNRHGLPRHDD